MKPVTRVLLTISLFIFFPVISVVQASPQEEEVFWIDHDAGNDIDDFIAMSLPWLILNESVYLKFNPSALDQTKNRIILCDCL